MTDRFGAIAMTVMKRSQCAIGIPGRGPSFPGLVMESPLRDLPKVAPARKEKIPMGIRKRGFMGRLMARGGAG